MCTGAQRRWRGTDGHGWTDRQDAPLAVPGGWVRQRHRTPQWVSRHPHRHSTARTTLESQPEMGCSPLREHPSPGDHKVLPPLCLEPHHAPPQLCSPHWELPTRASTHHPTSPTSVPHREPPAPRGLPGTSERPPAVRALGCSSRSFQWAGHTAGGLGTHQGCRQRGCPTPQHQHALAPRPSLQ